MVSAVTYKSSRDEKAEEVRARMDALRSDVDSVEGLTVLFTHTTERTSLCGDCYSREWFCDMTVLNPDNGKRVYVRSWWHSETHPEIRITSEDKEIYRTYNYPQLPPKGHKRHVGSLVSLIIQHIAN